MKALYSILCLVLIIAAGSSVAFSAPLEGDIISPVTDTFTDRATGEYTLSHDGQGLLFSSTDPAPTTGVATKVVFLKFDLRPTGSPSVGGSTGSLSPTLGPIVEARLNLAFPGSCGFSAPNVGIDLYPVADANDGWTGSLVWGPQNAPTHPPRDTSTAVGALPLSTLDEGTVGAPNDYYHWTDQNAAAYGLAEWLQAQRTTGDGFATLRLEVASGNSNFGFEDSEGTASGFGCVVPDPGGPQLQVADTTGPLTVSLTEFRSDNSTPAWPLYAGLGAVALLVVAGLAISRRRTA